MFFFFFLTTSKTHIAPLLLLLQALRITRHVAFWPLAATPAATVILIRALYIEINIHQRNKVPFHSVCETYLYVAFRFLFMKFVDLFLNGLLR